MRRGCAAQHRRGHKYQACKLMLTSSHSALVSFPCSSYGPKAYIRTKLCNVLFTRKLATLLGNADSGIRINAIHPGVVNTEIFHSRSHDPSRADEQPGMGEKVVRKVFESGMISVSSDWM